MKLFTRPLITAQVEKKPVDFLAENGHYVQADYIQFFDRLKEMLEEMFADVCYQTILVRVRLSNHSFIQKIYDKYKKKHRKTIFAPRFGAVELFESTMRTANFVVLSEKNNQIMA